MFVKMHRVMCFIVTALLILLQITCQNNIEVQFLCRNEECSEPIGEFVVKLSYVSDSPEKLSAKARDKGVILARPKDGSTHLWRVKIGDKIGFIPIINIQEMKKWEANTTVKLPIPVSSASKSNLNEQRNEINDSAATDLNSSIPHTEEIHNESTSFVDDSLNEKINADVHRDSDSAPKTESTEDQNSVPSSVESTNKDTKENKPEDESLENEQPLSAGDLQTKNLDLEKVPQILSDVSVKLENTSLEVNESEVVNVLKKSEYISESFTDSIPNFAENLTQEIHVEKENIDIRVENISDALSNVEENVPIDEILSTSESTSSTIETQKDTISSEVNMKNTQGENIPTENNTASNISPETEASNGPRENILQSSDETERDQGISLPVEAQVIAEAKVEPNLLIPSDTSLNNSTIAEVSNNSSADVEKSPSDAEPDLIPSTLSEVITSNETSAELNHDVPPMRMFPDDKESLVASEKSITSSEEIINSSELDDQNITSEKINASYDLDSNMTEENQLHDSVTPKGIPYDVYPPQHIESTTEITDNMAPIYTEESLDSNESVPIESPVPSSSSPKEDTPLSQLSEPYKYLKSSPYPGMLPNIAIENQPSVTEQTDSVSSQEIIETEREATSDSIYQASESVSSEPASVSSETEQKQGLNDFIHSSRIKVTEDEPVPINELETPGEISIYETIGEYFPDFSSLSEKLTNLFDFGSSSPGETPESEVCSAEQFCGTDRLNSHMDKPENPESENILEVPLVGVVNKEQVTYVSGILTSAFIATILLWWLMNYFNRSKKTTQLIQRINQLENKLLISTREVTSLQDKLVEQDSQAESKQNAADVKRVTEVYEHKINQYKKRIVELDDKIIYLEKELENVSDSALEMHKLLENSLATQAQSKLALDEVETLRTLAENQEYQIDELKKEINSVVTENECLKVDNEMNKSTIKKLEKECNAQTKKNVELSEKNRSLTLLLDKELENNTLLESNYKSEMYDLRSKLEDVEMNFKRSEFQVQELQRAILDKQDSVQGFGNDVQLKVQISTLEAMNKELSGQLNEQKNARRMLEDHVGDITKELNNLKKSFENSEKEKNQAVTKLQVLTQYFKDKEEQLHKELEAKDKLSLERDSKDQSLSQKLSLMREEISNLKIQNEELRKEVLDQEASYKVQLANAEQKTREHWFALRQAERKYKESQQEAAILRNKILVIETNMSSISLKTDDKNNSALNGDIPSSSSILYHPSLSPDLLPYPSSSDFIPPPPSPIPSHSPDFFPPEPIYSPDERLPPLGGRRGPSPPPPISPDDDFSPPPPVMKFPPNRSHNVEPPVPGGYSRRTPPPSGRHRSQYKSRPPRSSIDSPSSGMSLESLDKSGR